MAKASEADRLGSGTRDPCTMSAMQQATHFVCMARESLSGSNFPNLPDSEARIPRSFCELQKKEAEEGRGRLPWKAFPEEEPAEESKSRAHGVHWSLGR